MNTISLIGRLTADPAVHAGESHESATFRLAVPRIAADSADFIDIVTFDAVAKTVADYLTKGRRVAIVGRLRQSTWANADGEKRSKLQVVADTVIFLDKPKATDESTDGEADAPAVPDRPALGKYRKSSGAA